MIRRWMLPLLTAGFVWLVVGHLAEAEKLGRVLAKGQWHWILAAIMLQAAFATVGVASRLRDRQVDFGVLIAGYAMITIVASASSCHCWAGSS